MRLVSAIMPTKGRVKWANRAVDCFMSQTYINKELIIVDDPTDPSFPGGLFIPGRILRFIAGGAGPIAAKRNNACELAKGDIIIHFDDDDYSAPTRIADQVRLLEESGKAVAGFHSLLFHMEHADRCWKYVNDSSGALGTSLCYLKSWQQAHPFRAPSDTPLWGEDNEFVNAARNANQLVSVDAGKLMVARIHKGNTSVKDVNKLNYRPLPLTEIPEAFFG